MPIAATGWVIPAELGVHLIRKALITDVCSY